MDKNTDEQKDLLKKLRKLVFPKSKDLDVEKQLYGDNLCDITSTQISKIQNLWLNVYGQGKNGYNHSHHAFLQGIIEHKKIEYFSGHQKISDECLLDVYNIAPELFDIKKVEAFYKKYNVLTNQITRKFKIKKINIENSIYSFEYLENEKIIQKGTFIYDENFEIILDDENFEKLDSLNINKFSLMEMIEENKTIEILGISYNNKEQI